MARAKFLCDAERCIECNACVTACKTFTGYFSAYSAALGTDVSRTRGLTAMRVELYLVTGCIAASSFKLVVGSR